MTTSDRGPDVTTMIEDDLLLDQLGRGGTPSGDPAAILLSDWRATLPEPDSRLTAATAAAVARPRRRWARRAVAATAATVLLGGGVAVAAEQARPGNPLWPVTEWLYPGVADSRTAATAAADAVANAEAALAAGHPGDADRLLARATVLAEQVTDPDERAGLLSDIAALRARGAVPPAPRSPVTTDTPTVPAPTGPVEQAVPPTPTPTPRVVEPPPATTSTPDLPAETSLPPLPTLPLTPPLPGQ